MNELPLRHLLIQLDGVTRGPNSCPIGKAIRDCSLPVVSYKPILGNTLPTVDTDLSEDQKYLYEMCQAVISGQCLQDLSNRQPDPMHTLDGSQLLAEFFDCTLQRKIPHRTYKLLLNTLFGSMHQYGLKSNVTHHVPMVLDIDTDGN